MKVMKSLGITTIVVVLAVSACVSSGTQSKGAIPQDKPTTEIAPEEATRIVSTCQVATEAGLPDGTRITLCKTAESLDVVSLSLVPLMAIALAEPLPGDEVIVGALWAGTRLVKLIVVTSLIIAPVWMPLMEAVEPEAITVLFGEAANETKSRQSDKLARPSYPPPKDYCHEDLVELYTLFLLNETIARFLHLDPNLILQGGVLADHPLLNDADKVTLRRDQITTRLKEKGCYFYEGGGSVFSDYKSLREAAFPEDGQLKRYCLEKFSLDMSLEKALEMARQTVLAWW